MNDDLFKAMSDMTKPENVLKSDNELIAEFMGWQKDAQGFWPRSRYKLVFDTNWNELMPVVEKISRHVYEEHKSNNGYKDVVVKEYAYPRTFAMLGSNGFMVRINRMTLHEHENLITATYNAVVEWIKTNKP